jgi:hypothetical protein
MKAIEYNEKETNVKNTLQIHSQAKVEFYEKYVTIRFLYININTNQEKSITFER